jgi:Cu2+-exporting ATPase
MPVVNASSTLKVDREPASLSLEVEGMKCAGCVRAVEKRLTQQPGVLSASVNLVTKVATVDYEPHRINGDALAETLTEIGFPTQRRDRPKASLTPGSDPDLESPESQTQRLLREQIKQLTIAALLLILSSLGHLEYLLGWHLPIFGTLWMNIWLHWGLATLALLIPGRSIWLNGWQGLRHGIPNMNTLVGLGAWSAYGASSVALWFPQLGWECFFDEPVMLLGFILLGRTLEQRARHRASASLRQLLSLQPTVARLIADSDLLLANPTPEPQGLLTAKVVEVASDRLQVGEGLRVLPGEKFPVDGTVLAGQSTVNEAMLTGESLPVLKQPGSSVSAGSLNLSGVLVVQATQVGAETTLAQIIHLVETAQARKAPIQQLADIVAGYFTYGVMTIAALTFAFWFFLGTRLWPQVLGHHEVWMAGMDHGSMTDALQGTTSPLLLSLKLAIAVLVIACPCALGLATPTAMLVGSGRGAEQGLLIRGGDVLEEIDRLDTIVFDKTGTLTTGQPTVTDCLVLEDTLSPADVLQLAASIEVGTRHPLALAIQNQAQAENVTLLPAEKFHTEPGFGVSARIEGVLSILGNPAWLQQHNIEIPESAQDQADRLAVLGKTVIYLAQASRVLGLIAVADPLRSEAPEVIKALQNQGFKVLLLTGDHTTTTAAIAQSLQLQPDQVLAEIPPVQKAATLKQLQRQGQRVAMVGDGINDAPALAQANVGIALRSGTEVALETAQIVLMGDRLGQVLEALHLGKATLRKIRQNLFWALAYNIVGIPIAAGVLLPSLGFAFSPALAGALMAFSSITVVMNSLALKQDT